MSLATHSLAEDLTALGCESERFHVEKWQAGALLVLSGDCGVAVPSPAGCLTASTEENNTLAEADSTQPPQQQVRVL